MGGSLTLDVLEACSLSKSFSNTVQFKCIFTYTQLILLEDTLAASEGRSFRGLVLSCVSYFYAMATKVMTLFDIVEYWVGIAKVHVIPY